VEGLEKMYLYDKEELGRKWNHQQDINKQLFDKVAAVGDGVHDLEVNVLERFNKMEKKVVYLMVVVSIVCSIAMSIVTTVVIELVKGAL